VEINAAALTSTAAEQQVRVLVDDCWRLSARNDFETTLFPVSSASLLHSLWSLQLLLRPQPVQQCLPDN